MHTFHFTTISELEDIISEILPQLTHKIILLEGNLGAGKTTFSQLFCKSLCCTETVTSPTYSIVNEYHFPKGKIYHFDLYRLNTKEEVEDIGIEEYFDSNQYCIIEWPEIYMEEIPKNHHKICIFMQENNSRTLTLEL